MIVDYGLCNLLSVYNALKYIGVEAKVTSDPGQLKEADRVILPGVGAFEDGMGGLRGKGLIGPILEYIASGRPFLGICLGMQFLMTKSHEFGEHEGLNLIPGEVIRLDRALSQIKVPHIGWNGLEAARGHWEGGLLNELPQGAHMYFVHSYHAVPNDPQCRLADTQYGPERFCSVIHKNNIFGCQFHPEKSGKLGLAILNNFIKLRA